MLICMKLVFFSLLQLVTKVFNSIQGHSFTVKKQHLDKVFLMERGQEAKMAYKYVHMQVICYKQ